MFKIIKKRKKTGKRNNYTVDFEHNQMIDKFNSIHDTLPEKREQLMELQKELNQPIPPEGTFNPLELSQQRYSLSERIDVLKGEIESIESQSDKTDYYLKTSKLVYDYYDCLNNVSSDTSQTAKILSFFQQDQDKDIIKLEEPQSPTKTSRNSIAKMYFNIINPNDQRKQEPDKRINCTNCNIECDIIRSEGTAICENCGSTVEIIIDSMKTSYKDPPPEISYYAYQRKNHFLEIISQFQAKESTNIPDEVFDLLHEEIYKNKIKNYAKINYEMVKKYLKKLNLSKYYEHIPHIIYKLTGQPPPRITTEVETKLLLMFNEIQEPFEKVRPPDRNNFLNYKYVVHKFMELLGLDEYKQYFPFLKHDDRLRDQDQIWKKICNILGWQYIKSV